MFFSIPYFILKMDMCFHHVNVVVVTHRYHFHLKSELESQGETPKLTLYGFSLLSLKLVDKIWLQRWNKTKRVTENTILMLNSVSQDDLVQLCFCNEVTSLIHTHSQQRGEDEGFRHRETFRVCFEVYFGRFIQLFLFTSVLRCFDCLHKK